MSYNSSNGSYSGSWPQQESGQSSEAYLQDEYAYASRGRQMHLQPETGNSSYPYHSGESGNPHHSAYSNSVARNNPYAQSTAALIGAHSASHSIYGFAGVYQPGVYSNTPAQYNHQYGSQTQGWSNAQQSAAGSGAQRVMQSPLAVSPITYTSPALPLVAPRPDMGTGPEYSSSHTWPRDARRGPGSSNLQYGAGERSTRSGAECTVPCPYGCGTVLTGVHAVGNMTRHLKSQNCVGSGKDKTKYSCPLQGCDKRYIRSDGLKVHLRKRHNVSEVPDRTGSSEYEEVG